MGNVVVEARFLNHADEILERRGVIPLDDVRSVTANEMLVDTGATTLCLPIDLVERLGLRKKHEVDVKTAAGKSTLDLFEDATIAILGRVGTFDCIALPVGSTPLLGCVPLEMLGLEPDLGRRTLRVLPDSGSDTYWLAY